MKGESSYRKGVVIDVQAGEATIGTSKAEKTYPFRFWGVHRVVTLVARGRISPRQLGSGTWTGLDRRHHLYEARKKCQKEKRRSVT